MTLTNAEKQARYRERHLGVDGEKVRVGLNLNAGTRAKMGRFPRRRGYTITALTAHFRFAMMLVSLRSMRGSSAAPTSRSRVPSRRPCVAKRCRGHSLAIAAPADLSRSRSGRGLS